MSPCPLGAYSPVKVNKQLTQLMDHREQSADSKAEVQYLCKYQYYPRCLRHHIQLLSLKFLAFLEVLSHTCQRIIMISNTSIAIWKSCYQCLFLKVLAMKCLLKCNKFWTFCYKFILTLYSLDKSQSFIKEEENYTFSFPISRYIAMRNWKALTPLSRIK